MTGRPNWNFPAFHAAEEDLVAQGFLVENPARHFGGQTGLPWEIYMAKDMHVIQEECWGVITLFGWTLSRGARLEVALADRLGLDLLVYNRHREPIRHDRGEVRAALWTTTSKTAELVSPMRRGW